MKRSFEYTVDIPIERWEKAKEADTIADIAQEAGYEAIGYAQEQGLLKPIKNVYIEIVPDFSEESTVQQIKVSLEF